MHIAPFEPSKTEEVVRLFTSVFSASEGEAEGQRIGALVSNLATKTDPRDLMGFVATDHAHIVGCVFFSRFTIPSEKVAFILSPVAVATAAQGAGIGQQLINHGLDCLRTLNVDMVFTYGDPAYYAKTGFVQISERAVKAPYTLSQPIGWLAQALNHAPIQAMQGPTRCVDALSDPTYW